MTPVASFMPKPFSNRTGTGAHFHISRRRGGREERLLRRLGSSRSRAFATGILVPGWSARARSCARGDLRADGELVQAPRRGSRALGRNMGAGVHRLRQQQSHGLCAHPVRPHRDAAAGRLDESLSRDGRHRRSRARRHRSQARSGRAAERESLRAVAGADPRARHRLAAAVPERSDGRARSATTS